MENIRKTTLAVPIALLSILMAANIAAVPHEDSETTTPIQRVVVIFQENVSFDHCFGTYPNAANPPNESQFTPPQAHPR